MCICGFVFVHVSAGTCRVQKGALALLGLELQMVLSCPTLALGNKLWSPAKEVHTLIIMKLSLQSPDKGFLFCVVAGECSNPEPQPSSRLKLRKPQHCYL